MSGLPAGEGLASQGDRALAAFNVEQTHAAAVSERQRWIDPHLTRDEVNCRLDLRIIEKAGRRSGVEAVQ